MTGTRFSLVFLALLASAVGISCHGKNSRPKGSPRQVALVKTESISDLDFQRELERARALGDEGVPTDALRRRVIENMIDQALLLQEAKARAVIVGQDQVERSFLELRSQYPGAPFEDLLARERLSIAGLKTRIRDQLTIEKLFAENVFAQVAVPDEEVQRYYAEHSAEFEQPEQVHAFQVVVKTEEEAKAIREELRRNPQSFEAVAERSSIAPERAKRGDLGYFRRDWMPDVFAVCFRLGLNTVSDVIPSPFGFHIFKVVDRKPAGRRSFDQARVGIRQRLLVERRAAAQTEFLGNLKKQAQNQITIDWEAVASVTP